MNMSEFWKLTLKNRFTVFRRLGTLKIQRHSNLNDLVGCEKLTERETQGYEEKFYLQLYRVRDQNVHPEGEDLCLQKTLDIKYGGMFQKTLREHSFFD